MNTRKQLALAALLCIGLASDGAFAQGLGAAPRGTNIGQDTTAPGSKGDQQQHAGAAHSSSGGSAADPKTKKQHEGASAGHSASAAGY